MLNVCGPSVCKPLEIIFNQYLETGVFSYEWKKVCFYSQKMGQTNIVKLQSSVATTYMLENSWKINV